MSEIPTGSGPVADLVPVEEPFVSAEESVESDLEILTAQPTNVCGFSVSN